MTEWYGILESSSPPPLMDYAVCTILSLNHTLYCSQIVNKCSDKQRQRCRRRHLLRHHTPFRMLRTFIIIVVVFLLSVSWHTISMKTNATHFYPFAACDLCVCRLSKTKRERKDEINAHIMPTKILNLLVAFVLICITFPITWPFISCDMMN